MKLLAIDGNSIVNRAFYGIKLLTTKGGQHTNGIYGFINILNKLIELENPDCVAVAFDVHAPSFRHEKYAEYKAGRKGMPEELRSQMPILKQWLTLAGYHCIELAGYEADDILGTLSASAEKSGNQCVISTGDRDSLQLVGDNTRVLLTVTKMGRPELTEYNKQTLFEKYGLTPDEMIELKALMGDSSDNIPGVAGVGEKTAGELIRKYHNIDYIYDNLDSLDIKESVKNKLANGRDSAYLSRWLGTINKNVPIDTDYNSYLKQPMDEANLVRLMTKLEFYKLMGSMGLNAAAAADSEVTAEKRVFCAADSHKFAFGNCADILCNFESGKIGVASADNVTVFDSINDIKAPLENEKISKRIYDSKNFTKLCIQNGIDIKNIGFDSMLAGYLASPSANDYSVARLSHEYGAAAPEIKGGGDEFINTAALHSVTCDMLYAELEKNGQLKLLDEIEIPLATVLADMELTGVLVDRSGIAEYGDKLEERIDEIEKEIYGLVGCEFNLNSPKQLGVALFEKLGLPAKKKTKSGYSTSAEVLEELKDIHPAVSLLLEYRRLSKIKSTYCDGLCAAAGDDGRIHSTFNQTETRTGRISSLEPNLQNIPVRTDEGRQLRKYFIAPEGYVLCDADYSQIELRVLAHISNDKNMINAFNSGADIHKITASEAFDIPIDMVTPLMRSRAKAVNFGIVYGIGAFSLAKDIGVTRAEASNYIKGYLSTYPGVDKYMKDVIDKAKEQGYVTTLFGRRRYLPELTSSNAMLRAFGERVARNAPIQGTAADIIKIAMIRVYNRLKAELPDAKLILQVHDELIVECKKDVADKVCGILEQEMSAAAKMTVELSVDAHSGSTWYSAKG